MTRALTGVEGAYLMMPPVQAPSRDFSEAKAVLASYKQTLAQAFEKMMERENSGWISFGIPGTERIEGPTSAQQVFTTAKQANKL